VERVVERVHEDPSHDVDHRDSYVVIGFAHVAAVARYTGRKVGRSEQTWLELDVVECLLLVPDVIARRHDLDPGIAETFGDVSRDPHPARRILDVGNGDVDAMTVDQHRNGFAGDLSSGLAHDVTNKENLHLARVRTHDGTDDA
jgi:hypothetical protein